MMNYIGLEITSVSFFGHRYIDRYGFVERKLTQLVRDLMTIKPYVEFLVGREGDFDRIASSTIRHLRNDFGEHNSAHDLILPYMTAEFRDNEESFYEYYSEVEIASDATGKSHFKAAYQKRNRYMVDRSDIVIVYIDHESGGAYQTYQYALKQGKTVINIADMEE